MNANPWLVVAILVILALIFSRMGDGPGLGMVLGAVFFVLACIKALSIFAPLIF